MSNLSTYCPSAAQNGLRRAYSLLSCVTLTAGLFLPNFAQACECEEEGFAEKADAIFEAHVLETKVSSDSNAQFEVSVVQFWKGQPQPKEVLLGDTSNKECPFAVDSGSNYLVYATKAGDAWKVDACRMLNWEDSQAQLRELGAGVTPPGSFSKKNHPARRKLRVRKQGCSTSAGSSAGFEYLAIFGLLAITLHRRKN